MRTFHTEEPCPHCLGTLDHVYKCECKQEDDGFEICIGAGRCQWWECALCKKKTSQPKIKHTRAPRTDTGTEKERRALDKLLSECDSETFTSKFRTTTNYVDPRGDPSLLEHPIPAGARRVTAGTAKVCKVHPAPTQV